MSLVLLDRFLETRLEICFVDIETGQEPFARFTSHRAVILAIARGEEAFIPGGHSEFTIDRFSFWKAFEECLRHDPIRRPSIDTIHCRLPQLQSVAATIDAKANIVSDDSQTRTDGKQQAMLEPFEAVTSAITSESDLSLDERTSPPRAAVRVSSGISDSSNLSAECPSIGPEARPEAVSSTQVAVLTRTSELTQTLSVLVGVAVVANGLSSQPSDSTRSPNMPVALPSGTPISSVSREVTTREHNFTRLRNIAASGEIRMLEATFPDLSDTSLTWTCTITRAYWSPDYSYKHVDPKTPVWKTDKLPGPSSISENPCTVFTGVGATKQAARDAASFVALTALGYTDSGRAAS